MDLVFAAVVALAGAAVGGAAVLAFTLSERATRGEPMPVAVSPAAHALPEGVADVLAVLGSSAVVVDADGRALRASAAARALGVVRGDSLALPELVDLADEVRRNGEIRETELVLTRGPLGHRDVYVNARLAPLSSRLVLILVEDRTEAHRINAVRQDFVANVSHELKTPVGALALLAEAVQDASDDPDAVQRFGERMHREAARLTRLVQEIIDLSRLQWDDPLESPDVVAVDEVVAAAVDRASVGAHNASARIVVTGATGCLVLGSRDQLEIAVGNLVENAVAYSNGDADVNVDVHRSGEVVELDVVDRGIGIPESEQDRVFERFYRVDAARSRATGGTGLGLSIVKHIVASHGGQVTLRSRVGEGSTFTLRLPSHTPAPQARRAPAPRPGLRADEPGGADMTPRAVVPAGASSRKAAKPS